MLVDKLIPVFKLTQLSYLEFLEDLLPYRGVESRCILTPKAFRFDGGEHKYCCNGETKHVTCFW
jgi:hypothetical protein